MCVDDGQTQDPLWGTVWQVMDNGERSHQSMSELESGHCYEMEGSNIPASIFDCNQWLQGGGGIHQTALFLH